MLYQWTTLGDLTAGEHTLWPSNQLKSLNIFFETCYGHVAIFFVKSLRWILELLAGNC